MAWVLPLLLSFPVQAETMTPPAPPPTAQAGMPLPAATPASEVGKEAAASEKPTAPQSAQSSGQSIEHPASPPSGSSGGAVQPPSFTPPSTPPSGFSADSFAESPSESPAAVLVPSETYVSPSPSQQLGAQPSAASNPSSVNSSGNHSSGSGKQRAGRDLGAPLYTYSRPQWALELLGSVYAFGGTALTSLQASSPADAIGIQFEYQPAFLQSLGVFGIGPSIFVYPFPGNATSGFFSVYAGGGQIRYQARYFREQPLVPMVAYAFEYFSYNFADGTQGSLLSQGPSFGLWLYLNFLEPSSANHAYMDGGIKRTYAVVELRNMSGKDSNISFSGSSIYFGLRFEF